MNEDDTIYEGELFDRLEALRTERKVSIVAVNIPPRKEIVWIGGRKLEYVKTYDTWERVCEGRGKNKKVSWVRFDRG